ncbi:MAG: pyridoxal-phosphate dependent enzyme [Chloroflexi bacterium]|nr:pyridoxal-phosphate dependent enzyme [Chloroflexota bacterium]
MNTAFAQEILSSEAWLPTPLLRANTLSTRLKADIWLKREDCTPVGSFKLRGGLVTMAMNQSSIPPQGVYVASAGNYGLGIAEAGKRHHVKVTVFVPEGANPSKVEKIRLTGAEVVHHGSDFDVAKEYCREKSEEAGAAFWEDGVIEGMAFGAATIGLELLDAAENWDYVLVPLGNGSLIKGIATVFRERSPRTKVVALVPSGSPSMAQGLKGEAWDETAPTFTEADGLDVRMPIVPMVEELRALVHETWLIEESLLLPAVRTLMELEQAMIEPSGAICAAAFATHKQELSGKKVAAILTGGHLRNSLFPQIAKSNVLEL